jgi:hypothetical protein
MRYRWWPQGQTWYLSERLWLVAPEWSRGWWHRVNGWHGGDEYGNCSVYFRTGFLGGIVLFYELDFQRDVLVPDPGECKWIDRRYYDGGTCPGACFHHEPVPGCDGYPAHEGEEDAS